jgi:hypothetical protein
MAARTADDEPSDDAGRDVKGDEKGFALGAGEISSPKGLLVALLSGVPGRGVVAVETPELPRYCIVPSISCPQRKKATQRTKVYIKY